MRSCLVILVACASSHTRPPIAWNPPVEIAKGGGMKGPWQQNESRFDYVDDPSVALAPDGAAAVVWTDHRTKDLHFQIYELDGRSRFARPANISRTPAVFSWLPRIAWSGNHVFVLWQEIVFSGGTHGGEVFFARSLDGGATFDPPANVSRSINGDGKGRLDSKTWDNGSLDLVVDSGSRSPTPTLHATWTEYDGPLWVSRSEDGGETFSAPLQVGGTKERPARAPSLATHRGAVYVAWTVGEEPSADIRIARSTDAGVTFDAGTIVGRTSGYSDAPKLAVDDAGVLHLAYAESTTGWRDRAAIHYTRSHDGRTFEPARVISTPAPHRAVSAAYPSLSIDGTHVYVSWELYRSDGELPRGLAITSSLDGGHTFAAPSFVDGSADPRGWNGSQQGRLMRKLAVRSDRIVIVNSALEHGDHSRVWLLRGRRAR